jgi:dihydrodipicolinate synthase/N-acetylneuraminate lyase
MIGAMNPAGVYSSTVTPSRLTRSTDEIDDNGLAHNVKRRAGTSLRGLPALGQNGEAAFADEDDADRCAAARVAVAAVT